MRCFSCNGAVEIGAADRVGFRDECDLCSADLHVCRNCAFHDPSAYNECRESSAERVADRERANRCDYFSAGDRRGGAAGEAAARSRADLDALFKK